MRPVIPAVALALSAVLASSADKPKTTAVDLRALPRVAAAPVTVTFNVELSGGVAAQPCPTLEWEWGDGTRTEQEDACAADDADAPANMPADKPADASARSDLRHFTASHEYRRAGRPRVTLTVRQEGRTLGHASVALIIGEPKHPLTGSVRQVH